MIDFSLNLSSILQGLTVAGIVGIFKLSLQMRDHLAKLNGRISKAEQWQDLHAEQCQDRHQQSREESRMQWEAITRLQERP